MKSNIINSVVRCTGNPFPSESAAPGRIRAKGAHGFVDCALAIRAGVQILRRSVAALPLFAVAVALLACTVLNAEEQFPDAESPALSPFVVTDKADYAPGETAVITAGGFAPGERVELQVLHADGTPDSGEGHEVWSVIADALGNFQTTWHVCEDDCLGSLLYLSAIGEVSQVSTGTFFTDSNVTTLVFNSTFTGWYSSSQGHSSSNPNYIVGQIGNAFRNFFSFNLGALNLTGKEIISARLVVRDGICSSGNNTVSYRLFDVTTSQSVLHATHSAAAGLPIWTDLGSGQSYGTFSQSTLLIGTRTFVLNSAAISDISARAGGLFSIGGALLSPPANAYLFGCSGPGAQQLIIEIVPINEPPADIILNNASVPENQPADTTIGSFSAVDPDAGDTHIFTLASGAGDEDNASFTIDGNALKTAAVFDYESKSSYSIRVRATDAGGLFFEKGFVIQITDVNEAPFVANPLGDLAGMYGHAFSATFPADTFADPDIGQTLSYTATGLPPGVGFDGPSRTFSGAPTATGNFTVTVVATDDGVPLLGASESFDLTVSPTPLSVTANNTARAYGDANPVFTGTLTGVVNSDNITAGYTTPATGTSPVGEYAIVPALDDPDGRLANYTVTVNNGALAITARQLNVAANAQSKIYGDADPTLTLIADALVAGDNLTGALERASGEDVGTYSINQGTLSAGENYSIAFAGADLEITPASLVVSAEDANRAYGEANPAFTGSVTGVIGGDTITADYNTSAAALSPVGTYSITPSLNDLDDRLGNYVITINDGTLTVNPAVATVAANPKSKIYGEANPALDAFVSGAVSDGDSINYSLDTTATQFSLVGSYPIEIILGSNPNYSVTATDSLLTVLAAELDVAIHDPVSGYLARINDPIIMTGSFSLTGEPGAYSAYWTFSSATTPPESVWVAVDGTDVTDSIQFTEPGVYTIQLTVTDPAGTFVTADTIDNDLPAYVVIYDPEGGFVTGGGWIWSPEGAFHPELEEFADVTGRATFGFVSRYQRGASVPTGNTEFQFRAGDLNFRSTEYQWLVISGARAQYKGWGTINGQGDYGFLLTAIDGQVDGGGGEDRFRLKIWDETSGTIIYDNQHGADDNAELEDHTVIGGGSIVIHSPPPGKPNKK